MKIGQLLSGMYIVLTNEEQSFIRRHKDSVSITSLNEHDHWLAQNLVRKGLYSISKDNRTLIKQLDETTNE